MHDARVPPGSLWRVKHRTVVYSRPLSRWRAIQLDAKELSLNEGCLITVLRVESSEALLRDPTEKYQSYVAVLMPEICYVNRVHFNSDSIILERVT